MEAGVSLCCAAIMGCKTNPAVRHVISCGITAQHTCLALGCCLWRLSSWSLQSAQRKLFFSFSFPVALAIAESGHL